jgi:hypothetical protein
MLWYVNTTVTEHLQELNREEKKEGEAVGKE